MANSLHKNHPTFQCEYASSLRKIPTAHSSPFTTIPRNNGRRAAVRANIKRNKIHKQQTPIGRKMSRDNLPSARWKRLFRYFHENLSLALFASSFITPNPVPRPYLWPERLTFPGGRDGSLTGLPPLCQDDDTHNGARRHVYAHAQNTSFTDHNDKLACAAIRGNRPCKQINMQLFLALSVLSSTVLSPREIPCPDNIGSLFTKTGRHLTSFPWPKRDPEQTADQGTSWSHSGLTIGGGDTSPWGRHPV